MFMDYTDLLGLLAYSLPNRTARFSTGSAAIMLLTGSKCPAVLQGQEEATLAASLYQLGKLFNCFNYF
jgi:hypothetical protein